MKRFDKNTLQECINDFQEIFERFNILDIKIDFVAPSQGGGTTFFIEPSDKADKVKKEIKDVLKDKKLYGIIYVHGNKAFGQEWDIPKDAINFNELLEEVRTSRNPAKEQINEQPSTIEKFLLDEKDNLMIEKVTPTITPKAQKPGPENVEAGQSKRYL